MLGKTKKPEDDTPFTVTKKEEAKPTAPSPRPTPTPTPSEEKTTIGENISIEGQIKGQEHLVIEGTLKGNVEMEKHNFMVGSNGRVDGEIRAQNVSISGQLQGTINAMGKVEITKEADFYGDIKAKSLSVEDGAYFKGSIELDREPHRKSNFAAAPKGPSSSGAGKAALAPSTATKQES
jgi:cytoskeletal protein CcmA (bactofilin family)